MLVNWAPIHKYSYVICLDAIVSIICSGKIWQEMYRRHQGLTTLLDICPKDFEPQPQLSHWGRYQMVAISQTTFLIAFLEWNVWTSFENSLKFVPKVRINNIPALVQIMALHRSGEKPLSEPMMVSLLTHICFIWPQWVDEEGVSIWNDSNYIIILDLTPGFNGRQRQLLYETRSI